MAGPMATTGRVADILKRCWCWFAACCLVLAQTTALAGEEPMSVIVALPGPGSGPMLPLELMPRLNFDRLEGIKVTLRFFAGGPPAIKDMLTGNSDFAVAGFPAFAAMHGVEGQAYSVAAVTQTPAYTLMIAQRHMATIRGPHDLAGRTIGVHTPTKAGQSTARQMAEFILHTAGISADQVNFVSIGQDYDAYVSAIASGSVDAIVVNEPSATKLETEHLAHRLVDLHEPNVARKYMGSLFLYTQLCAREATIRAEPEKIRRMVSALRHTLQWIQLNAVQDFVVALGIKDEEQRTILTGALARNKRMYSPDAEFSNEQVRAAERFLRVLEPEQRHPDGWMNAFIDDRWAGRRQ